MLFSSSAMIAVASLLIVYFFLITEKLDKVIVAIIGAAFLITTQIFRAQGHSSQENALEFVSKNLDVLGFIIGMMILINVIRRSGVFEAIAIWIVKKLKGNPAWLLGGMGYLAFVMTIFISNIPTVLILSPVLLVLVRQLKLPYFPYFFAMIAMANLGGAVTPISDPTTYYEAKTVGLTFVEVVKNSGVTVCLLSIVTTIYCQLVFRAELRKVKVLAKDVVGFKPGKAIKDKKVLVYGIPLLIATILLMVGKEWVSQTTGIALDNATIVLGAAFIALLVFRVSPHTALQEYVGWEIIFFFLGLFVVVGSLEFTGVIHLLGDGIVQMTGGKPGWMLFALTFGSGILSTFIDNVPYNITMVGAIQAMAAKGIQVYPLWWGLNVGTSLGGAGSMIAAACNVIALGHAEKEGFHTGFMKFFKYGFPLVLLNGLIGFGILYLKFLA